MSFIESLRDLASEDSVAGNAIAQLSTNLFAAGFEVWLKQEANNKPLTQEQVAEYAIDYLEVVLDKMTTYPPVPTETKDDRP